MTLILKNAQNEVIMALALILLGVSVGYNVSEPQNTITIDSDYDSYQVMATNLNIVMQDVITNPGNYDLGTVQGTIFYDYYPWVQRHPDPRQETFTSYLEACNQIIISISNGETADTTEMYRLYYLLVPEDKTTKQNVEVNSPYLWAVTVPSN